jgi:hypothetical protein
MTQGRCRADGTGAAARHQKRAVSNGTNRNPGAGLGGGNRQAKMVEPEGTFSSCYQVSTGIFLSAAYNAIRHEVGVFD